MKAGYIAYGISAGFCLLCVLIPGIAGTFTGASDAGMNEMIVDALAADRQTLMTKDAIRSLILISCVFGLLVWAFRTPKTDATGKNGSFVLKGRLTIAAVAVVLLVFFDLAGIGKRYLNKSHFITPKDFTAHYEPRPVDDLIHQDTDPDFRVLDLSVNTFNDAIQSYHHKCIGGYSPVKLQRYQDLIDRYITKEIRDIYGAMEGAATVQEVAEALPETKVVSMLNGRYIILDGNITPVVNKYAYGNCWFVDSVAVAPTPDDEISLLASTDLQTTAVVGDDFAWAREADAFSGKNSVSAFPERGEGFRQDLIYLDYYAPNELRYMFSTARERAAVFSEIYYPKGWKAWIEPAGAYGEVKNGHYQPTAEAVEVELFRADWILRAAIIPEGEGPNVYVWIEKLGRTTLDVVLDIARDLHVSRKRMGFAGMKDKKAITRQWICIANMDSEEQLNQVKALDGEIYKTDFFKNSDINAFLSH